MREIQPDMNLGKNSMKIIGWHIIKIQMDMKSFIKLRKMARLLCSRG